MKKQFTFTVPAYSSNVGRPGATPPGEYTVELIVDEAQVIRALGNKAARSKGGQAKECGGAVVVKVVARPSTSNARP